MTNEFNSYIENIDGFGLSYFLINSYFCAKLKRE